MCKLWWVLCANGENCTSTEVVVVNGHRFVLGDVDVCPREPAKELFCDNLTSEYKTVAEQCYDCRNPAQAPHNVLNTGPSAAFAPHMHPAEQDEIELNSGQIIPLYWRAALISHYYPLQDRCELTLRRRGNITLSAPLTYEVRAQFKERQKYMMKHIGRNLDLEYMVWTNSDAADFWLPSNKEGHNACAAFRGRKERAREVGACRETDWPHRLNTGQFVSKEFYKIPKPGNKEEDRYRQSLKDKANVTSRLPLAHEPLVQFIERSSRNGRTDRPFLINVYDSWVDDSTTDPAFIPQIEIRHQIERKVRRMGKWAPAREVELARDSYLGEGEDPYVDFVVGFLEQFAGQETSDREFLMATVDLGHVWVVDGRFNPPPSWVNGDRWYTHFIVTESMRRERYSLALEKAPNDPTPLPHETLEQFVARQHGSGISKSDLGEIYERWLNNDDNWRLAPNTKDGVRIRNSKGKTSKRRKARA